MFNPIVSTIAWTFTDVHGNQSTCSTIVTINNSSTITVYILPSFTKEGNSGRCTIYFALLLNKPSPGNVSVKYTTSDGSAKAGFDYDKASGTVSFSKGQWLKFFAVNDW